MPWEYTEIKTNHMPPCPVCEKTDAVKRAHNSNVHPDTYTCGDCGTTFVAVWRPA